MGSLFTNWPWKNMGSYKYLLFGPFMAQVAHLWWNGEHVTNTWCFQILLLCFMRYLIAQLWHTYSNMHFLIQNRRIINKSVDFKQIDHEWDWDNFIISQAIVGGIMCHMLPSLTNWEKLWDTNGLIVALVLHVLVSEPLYYRIHKNFHSSSHLFNSYHSFHHSSTVPQPFTAGNARFLEHILDGAVMGIPLIGASLLGFGSISLGFIYVLTFDFLRCMGYSNVEIFSHQIFELLPFLKYLICTPTYRSLHHSEGDSNFCLFMPIYDVLGHTLNKNSWELQKKISINAGKNIHVPEFVFLAHIVDITSAIHVPFMFRSFASLPYATRWFIFPVWLLSFVCLFPMWAWAKPFTVSFYNLRNKLHHTWTVPRFGFQYFIPFAAKGINEQIEHAILKADKMGVKVLSLAALNKNEALNGGGMLFVKKHPKLRVRVVHGNTLTAAVTINQIRKDVVEVFLTGSTSKLGRAIALYLCQRQVRVLMLTSVRDRFLKIQKEAPIDCQRYLVHVTKYEAGSKCKTWIVGKWIRREEQRSAPSGTHFHQFVVPPISSCRKDCSYGQLAAMKLPLHVQGLGNCEYTLERGVIHACHAGGVVHSLEGWTHHEVGPIDVHRIDIVWEAALSHGLTPLS